MKCLKVCEDRTEAETIIQGLKKIGIIAMIKAVQIDNSSDTKLHLMVDENEYDKAALTID